MAVEKRVIDLQAAGERLEFDDSRERTNGRRSAGTMTLAPGGQGPGLHVHTRQREGFEVVSGTLQLVVAGKTVTLRPGESYEVGAGQVHTFRNGDPAAPVVARFWFEPALNIEWMLQTLGEWAMERGGDWKFLPPMAAGHLLFVMRDEYRLGGAPYWAQDLFFGMVSLVGRLTGKAPRLQPPAAVSRAEAEV